MSLMPAFEIGLWNAWIFMSVFLVQWLAVILAGQKISRRTGHPAEMEKTGSARRQGMAATITWVVATLYSIFLPFHTGTIWFRVGLGFFIVGLAILVVGTYSFAVTSEDKPVTRYVFRYTRHPMYLSVFLIYIGASLAAASWFFLLLTLVTFFLTRRIAISEENYCLNKYGDAYRDYRDRTPRWLGVPEFR